MRSVRASACLLVAIALVLGAAAEALASPFGRVEIRRTEHGIPHIQARSFLGMGYGFGYAFAQDNLCTMADTYVTVDAQRSRYFGADGSYVQRGNGTVTNNLDSDLYWQSVKDSRIVERLLAQGGRFRVSSELRRALRGYVAGYNRYLRSVGGRRGVPDPTCRGRAWVRPISLATAYRRLYQLSGLASAGVAIPGVAAAQPPGAAAAARTRGADAHALAQGLLARPVMQAAGSNAVAVGRAATRDRRHGLLIGNPHFPWTGPERFYQAHLRIPGKLDVAGAMLYGVPLVLIGHTRSLAWSHTVSTAYRFTPYELKLVPGSPTSYLVDGKPVEMTRRTVSVRVREGSGLRTVSRTLYGSRWGPIFNELQGTPLPWSGTSAFAFADANAENLRAFSHFLATNRAQSVRQELRVLRRYEGLPWVNTIAADRSGHALYADIGTIPHVSNDEAQRCNTALGGAIFAQVGLPILDGSRSACAWGSDRDSAVPGIFGASRLPHLQRSDYVTNSNDSYWLSNPERPLEGYARIIGDERTQRTLRTRIGLIMTQGVIRGGGFTRRRAQAMTFSNRQYGGELVRDGLVGLCRALPGGMAPLSSGGTIAVGDACDVLARWDLHENLRSRGAILFRRFWWHAPGAAGLFSRQFDFRDPVLTPSGFNAADPANRVALGDAIRDLGLAGIPLDAAPGDVQRRENVPVPIHGGPGDPNGQFNAISAPFVEGRGFAPVEHGSSFVQVVTWNRGRCPNAATILTYSLSSNPRSRFFADQTRLFSRKRWLSDHFCRGDVVRHTRSMRVLSRR
jgi:acyl-homoserine-lactone acylase